MRDCLGTYRRGRLGGVLKLSCALVAAAPAAAFAEEFTAVQSASGSWGSPATWGKTDQEAHNLPANGDSVVIPRGITVTFDQEMTSGELPKVTVRGALIFSMTRNTKMRVETLFVDGGLLKCGNSATDPLPKEFTMGIVITHGSAQIPALEEVSEMGRGLISMGGSVQLFGAPKTKWALLQADAVPAAADTEQTLTLKSLPADWKVHDQIVVAPTDFDRERVPADADADTRKANGLKDDRGEIKQLTPLKLENRLRFEHRLIPNNPAAAPRTYEFDVHVVNLTRNITISSAVDPLVHVPPSSMEPLNVTAFPTEEWPLATSSSGPTFRKPRDDVRLRGHVMFMPMMDESMHDHESTLDVRGAVTLRNVAFVGLGRTDKTVMLNDVNAVLGGNRRGRYSCHFHQVGPRPNDLDANGNWKQGKPLLFTVTGCVVDESPGWGFVNHSSNVNFTDNIAYDFDGAGFMTEAGDEIGDFVGNIAIRGHGDGQHRRIRIARNNFLRHFKHFFDVGDLGFGGDGFWFQGPGCRFIGNVAAGCRGHGVIWHNTGLVERAPPGIKLPDDGEGSGGRYTGFPKEVFDLVYPASVVAGAGSVKPRRWKDAHLQGFANPYVIADLPFLEVSDFRGYANLTGFMMRWCNHDSVTNGPYSDLPYSDDDDMTTTSKQQVQRVSQSVSGLELWNNETGMQVRYVEKTDFDHVTVVNRLSHDRPGVADGITARRSQGLGHKNDFAPGPGWFQSTLLGTNYDWPYVGVMLDQVSARQITLAGSSLVVDGYPVAVLRRVQSESNLAQALGGPATGVVVTGNPKFLGALEPSTMMGENLDVKPVLTPAAVWVQGAVQLSWKKVAGARYIVRYRVKPTQPAASLNYWNYLGPFDSPAGNTVNHLITGPEGAALASGQFEAQVMFSTKSVLSPWSKVAQANP